MPVNLLNPVNSRRTKSVNFFNGRLLSGEDLTTEQKTNRVAHSLLGTAIGDGVVYGLEVKQSTQSTSVQSPMVSVSQGLAVNKNGAALLLDADTEVALVRPAGNGTNASSSTSIFQNCVPVQSGNYVAGAGVFLLTVGPATTTEGLAEVSGVSTTNAPCNSKYNVQGVQFRLICLNLTPDELADVNHLRNLVAYKCFGFTPQNNSQSSFAADPFNTPLTTYGLLDDLRATQTLTNCEVPLAVMYWTADAGLVFIDMWTVRRPVFPQAATEMWTPLASRRRMAEGMAMFLQFQEQINDMVEFGVGGAALTSIAATDYFHYLPAAGLLPILATNDVNTSAFATFFEGLTVRGTEYIEGTRLQPLVRSSFAYSPIDLATGEFIWLYTVRENIEAFDNTLIKTPQAYLVFSNGHMPYQADARFDGERWDYSNYALR